MTDDLKFCPKCTGPLEVRNVGHPASPHPTCGACGFVLWQNMKPSIEALIVRGDGAKTEILLGQRDMGGGRIGWDLPGGFLNDGDRLRDALRRECQREMGVKVEVGELLGAFEEDFAGSVIVMLVYLCRITSGEPRAADIIDGVAWFSLDDAIDPAYPSVGEAIEALRRRLLA